MPFQSIRGTFELRYPTQKTSGELIRSFKNISLDRACNYALRIANNLRNDRVIGVFNSAGEMVYGVQCTNEPNSEQL